MNRMAVSFRGVRTGADGRRRVRAPRARLRTRASSTGEGSRVGRSYGPASARGAAGATTAQGQGALVHDGSPFDSSGRRVAAAGRTAHDPP
ncbi:hypothetical protein GCM10018781_12020 [Kitasatospora indigofera]|uniref:Uncharacterized protein n=1 Tax=Kitasatospora indigofera TaxID=67307 RepID=A0A919KLX5_9ACTN|nr:hypothetical protein GCM10018781_12020 [Kitasatospora indigofera]